MPSSLLRVNDLFISTPILLSSYYLEVAQASTHRRSERLYTLAVLPFKRLLALPWRSPAKPDQVGEMESAHQPEWALWCLGASYDLYFSYPQFYRIRDMKAIEFYRIRDTKNINPTVCIIAPAPRSNNHQSAHTGALAYI